MKNRCVLILEDLAFVKASIDRIIGIIECRDYIVIPLSDSIYFYLESKGVKCISYHDFEYEGIYDEIYTKSVEWGTKWYSFNGHDFTSVNGYSAGNILEWSMIYFFSHYIKIYLVLEAIFRTKRYEEVTVLVALDSGKKGGFPLLGNVDVNMLPQILKNMSARNGNYFSVDVIEITYGRVIPPKKLNCIRPIFVLINSILSMTIKCLNKIFFRLNRTILFFEGAHHFAEIMRSSALKELEKVHLQKEIGPSLLAGLYLKGVRVETIKRMKNPYKRGDFALDKDGLLKCLNGFFILNGQDVLDDIKTRIEYLMDHYIPVFVRSDIISLKKVLVSVDPHCVVIENDATYYERMLCNVAKSLGKNVVVLQHGLTMTEENKGNRNLMFHDFVPLCADVFLAYGESAKNWMTSMGVNDNKVIVTGSSRFDIYYRNPKNRAISRKRKKVLIALNDLWDQSGVESHHIGLNVFYSHLKEIFKIAGKRTDIDFLIRPHHMNNEWGRIFEKELVSFSNVKISRNGSIMSVLEDTDLVIGYFSTVLLEALILGIPAISIDTSDFCNVLPLWKYGLSTRVSSILSLEETIEYELRKKAEGNNFSKQMNEALSFFNYDNDGNATVRIAAELYRIASGGND